MQWPSEHTGEVGNRANRSRVRVPATTSSRARERVEGRPGAQPHLGDITREHEAVDAQLADAAADELRILRPIVEDENQAVRPAA